MSRRSGLSILLVLVSTWSVITTLVVAEPLDAPFDAATQVPADVSFYLHVDDAASLRREMAGRPIGRWLSSLLNDSMMSEAWEALSESSGRSQSQLFDQLLGQRFTLVTRGADDGAEWAIITVVPEPTMRSLRQSWRLQRLAPRHGLALSVLPEQDIIIAEDGQTVVLGTRAQRGLFDELIASLGRPMESSLAEVDGLQTQLDGLDGGRCGVIVRHGAFVGGWSAVSMDLDGDALRLRHAAHFNRPPFDRPVTQATCDFSPLAGFEREQLLTVMEPTDIGMSRIERFAMQSIGEALAGANLRGSLGKRRIIAVGEEEGRMRDVPEDILAPVPAVCIEVEGDAFTITQLDQQMTRLASRLNDLNDGELLVNVPPVRTFEHGNARSIDISGAVDAFTGGFPIMKTLTLNWDVASGAHGTWCIVAGSPHQLVSVKQSLEAESAGPALVGQFDSVGTINGIRFARQLNTWARQAHQLAAPGQDEAFRQSITMLEGLMDSTERVRWRLHRPDTNRMRLNVDVILRDSPSVESP